MKCKGGEKMKKIILLALAMSVILLTGCGSNNEKEENKKDITSSQEQEKIFDATSYQGRWKASDDADEMNYVDIKVIDSNMIDFEYMVVSDAPYYRVANINVTDVILDKNGKGKFEFEDDGWNHKGEGTIQLNEEGVKITIEKIQNNAEASGESMWAIASGKYKEKLVEE